jgi:hypothetical protein
MSEARLLPHDPVSYIQDCVRIGQILWTYHVNMRMMGRFIRREAIRQAVDTYELVEAYPEDKYLPSYPILARQGREVFHVLFGVDVASAAVRLSRPTGRIHQNGSLT